MINNKLIRYSLQTNIPLFVPSNNIQIMNFFREFSALENVGRKAFIYISNHIFNYQLKVFVIMKFKTTCRVNAVEIAHYSNKIFVAYKI